MAHLDKKVEEGHPSNIQIQFAEDQHAIEKETCEYAESTHIIQIGRVKFVCVSPTTLTYNGHVINVEINRSPLYVKFIDCGSFKELLSPEDFISLNRLYKIDKALLVESDDFVFVADASLNTIRSRVLQFIEDLDGKYTYIDDSDEDDEFIMCTFKRKTVMIVCFNFVPIKGGYIVEIEKSIKIFKYPKEYYDIKKTFMKTFL